ncbi:leucine-rich repeat domain-containing protein [Paenibacillus sp. FSL R5-0908]
MYNNHIKEIPDQLFLHDELEVLNYAGNEIEQLSENIGRLVHLRMLDLGHNRLKVLPESIGGLQGLDSFLYLSNWPSCQSIWAL